MTGTTETLSAPGLKAGAEITVDCWGIPHIRAQNLSDLFFAQGFNAARDRLWQIDLWRKRGLGLLAADFGPGFLAQDQASRLFLYRGDIDADFAAYASDARDICTAFASGINAYVGLTEREPDRLPVEFQRLGTMPARWRPEDVVRIRSHALSRNALSEIARAQVLAAADEPTDLLRAFIEPPIHPAIPEGIDLASIPAEVLTLFKLATASVTFTPERLAAGIADAARWRQVSDAGEVSAPAEEGSNAWVVAASRSATGRPILASDPHRAHAIPSLRYLVHLTAPGFDAIGAGEPSVPGISIGHNESVAFGLTIFRADQEDVYFYETDPRDRHAYRHGAGFEKMRAVEERFVVRGAPDQTVTQWYTRHGPVVLEEPERGRAFAIRSAWFEPGGAAYLRSLTAMRCADALSFRASLAGWGTPSVNHVVADVRGTTLWQPSGAMPARHWDGLLPVPGDGSYEWQGFLPQSELPGEIDPQDGFFATANEMNLPENYPHKVGFEWNDGSRARRIKERLGEDPLHSLAAARGLQTDVVSMQARRMMALLGERGLGDPAGEAGSALKLFAGWDCALTADSAPAALFEIWWTLHLKPMTMKAIVPNEAVRKLLAPGDVEGLLQALERPDRRWGSDPQAARDKVLVASLASAWKDCAARLGASSGWAWGRLHHAYFEHALTNLARERAPDIDAGPWPHGGSALTPMHTGYRPSDFRTMHGASVRLVMDVGAWDNCVCINSPGQSGDPRSPHYRDLAPLWARGEYVPLLYSRPAIDAAAETRIELSPSK